MKEYKYQDRVFHVEYTGNCEVRVTDGEETAYIRLGSGTSFYTISSMGLSYGGYTTLEAAIGWACETLILRLTRPSDDVLCEEMSKFVEDL